MDINRRGHRVRDGKRGMGEGANGGSENRGKSVKGERLRREKNEGGRENGRRARTDKGKGKKGKRGDRHLLHSSLCPLWKSRDFLGKDWFCLISVLRPFNTF